VLEDQDMPEPYTEIKNGQYVHDGKPYTNDLEPHYKKFEHLTPSRHLSIVFNVFVWLQVFNMLCARKINDEINIFSGVGTNGMFMGVLVLIAGLQLLIMNSGPVFSP
jgi:magnesium-transporting ATPase (P-type)